MKLDVISEEETRMISPKLVNTKWKLSKQLAVVGNDLKYSTLTFSLHMKRNGSHYGFLYIFPVVLLAIIAIIYLFLRPIEIVKYIIGEFGRYSILPAVKHKIIEILLNTGVISLPSLGKSG